ncbi:hypothetical protein PspLS_01877 [Pyricularia sp. CBS 133598]|nr:hypothetical protein PspLS_01877 [Pyricularia sp. CBS 133598]
MGYAESVSAILTTLEVQGRPDEIVDPSDVRVCHRCSEILSQIEELSAQESKYHRHLIPRAILSDVSEIASSGPRECILCYRIQDYAQTALTAGRQVFALLQIHRNENSSCRHGDISLCHGDPWYQSGDGEYNNSTGYEFELHMEKGHRCTTECTTSRAATMALLKKWLNACQAEHSDCNYSANLIERPTRLLDVGTEKSDTVYLVSGADTKGHWAVMSYCWGRTEFVKLTNTNYSTMVAGVATAKLPKTFQDAVQTCHALGVRYLWIDALCIIQGPDGDFAIEAGRMASVYSGSYVSIAAAWGDDTSSGLFSQRLSDARHSVINRDGKTFTALLNQVRAGSSAPRVCSLPAPSFFATGGVWYECRSDLRTDFTSIMGLDTWAAKGLQKLGAKEKWLYKGSEKRLYELFVARGDREMNPRVTYTAWWSIVEDYSKMSLTHKSDKLAAMAGAAALLSTTLSDKRCSFGMWMQWLPDDLLFSRKAGAFDELPRISHKSNDRESPAEQMFPSWSWASYDGDFFTTPDIEANSQGENRKFCTTARARVVKYPPETSFMGDPLAQRLQEEPASIVIETVAFVCTAPCATQKDGAGNFDLVVCRQDENKPGGKRLLIQLDSPGVAAMYDESNPWICVLIRRTYEDSWRHDEGLVLRPSRRYDGKYLRVGYFDTGGGWERDRRAEDIEKERELEAKIGLKVAISDDGFFRPEDGFRLVETI